MKVRRKFCRLHGWAPHATWRVGGERFKACCRCGGPVGYTETAMIKAFLRGFKLRQRTPTATNARSFVGDRFK